MQSSFNCPVCNNKDWETNQSFCYLNSDNLPNDLGTMLEYFKMRRRVLFDVWFPNTDTILLQSLMCRYCGFMTFGPRPSAADVEAKYRFLYSIENKIEGQKLTQELLCAERTRAERVYQTVARHTHKRHIEVLDFGGGNGKLLLPFLERGHSCELVDYTLKPFPGIRKIGNTLEDVSPGTKYDVIICSHVLEHLAEPAKMVSELSKHLFSEGIIYAEVPQDIWKDIGIDLDPVTHINFFTKNCFELLFLSQALQVFECKQFTGTYYGKRKDVIMLVAQISNTPVSITSGTGTTETRQLLNPSIIMQFRRRWRYRQIPRISGAFRRIHSIFQRKFRSME